MTGLIRGIAALSASRTARTTLNRLTATVGDRGLAAAAHRPGLMAAVDQHAAAVRDSLRCDRRRLTHTALAGYAEGLCDAAMAHGWRLPEAPIDWPRADWVLVRLIAICLLARHLPTRRVPLPRRPL